MLLLLEYIYGGIIKNFGIYFGLAEIYVYLLMKDIKI